MNSYTLFISDVHLAANHEKSAALLRDFLHTHANQTDALYILGDFFDLWLGDDDLTVFNQEIIQLLAEFSASNTPLYYMLGNHDFLIGKKFFAKTGAKKLPDPTVINLYGKRILLCHGDGLCTNDTQHMRFRKIIHNKLIQKLFTCLSITRREKISNHINNKDSNYYQNAGDAKLTPPQHTVDQALINANSDFLVHGHTHRPKIHHFILNNKPATRCVLGYWGDGAEVLKYKSDHTYELINCAM